MKQKINIFELWRLIVRNAKDLLSIERDLTYKEKLENLEKNSKENQRLLDIKSIRDSGYYVPDYNKPKKHTDYHLSYEAPDVELYVNRFLQPIITEILVTKIVSPETKTTCKRPESFIGADGSTINAVPKWMAAIRESYEQDKINKQLKELQDIQHSETKQEHYEYVMQKMMAIN